MSENQPQKKRKPGRPKKTERPITPEILQEIGRQFLRGKSARQIALAIEVTENAVRHHLERTLKPLWRNSIQFDASIEIARADEVICLAFEGYDRSLRPSAKNRQKYSAEQIKAKIKRKSPQGANKERLVERTLETIERDGDKGWLELVHLMMDFKARVKGGYAPAQLRVHQQSEMRIAGLSPVQLDELMYRRIVDLAAERQQHAQLLETARRAAGQQN